MSRKATLGSFVFAVLSACSMAETKTIPPEQVPPVVWAAIQKATSGVTPSKVERHDDGGDVFYEAAFTARIGGERSVSVAPDGHVLSLEVTIADLPPAVRKTVATEVGDATLDGIDKAVDPDGNTYEVSFTLKDGGERSLSVAEDGTLISREVSLAEAPEPVQKTIQAHLAGGTLEGIEHTFDVGESSFEVSFTSKKGLEGSFTVAPDGRLDSEEVTLDTLPDTVQATIKEKTKGGEIKGLRKVFGKKGGVTRYEVESMVNGKSFEFKVGAKGKFLGETN